MYNAEPISSASDVKRLGTILFVGAHPDDETFCSGGLLATAVRNGQRVICVTATRGEQGVQDESKWPATQMGTIRTHELAAALRILGVKEHYYLNYPDGECDRTPEDDASQVIASLIERCNVDTILTFGPDGLTGHPDHQAVSRWVDAAAHIATRSPAIYHVVQLRGPYEKYLRPVEHELNLFFMAPRPHLCQPADCDVCIELDERAVVQKFRALQAMPSQYDALLAVFPAEKFAKVFGTEAFVLATDERR
jgi:LmbE family N-acetylglucosaminyl deacetylase